MREEGPLMPTGIITSCHSKTELTAPCEWAKRVTMSPRAIASIEAQRWGGRWGPLQDRGCRFSSLGSSFIRSWWSVGSSRAPAVIPTEVEGSRPVLRAQGTTSAKPARSVVRSMVPCAPQTGARSLKRSSRLQWRSVQPFPQRRHDRAKPACTLRRGAIGLTRKRACDNCGSARDL